MGGLLLTLVSAVAVSGDLTVGDLRCEYLERPLAIEELRPRFSWVLESGVRGARQSAYRVLVSSSPAGTGDLWDSGKVLGEATLQVEYAGKPLTSRQRAYWKVQVWDGSDIPSAWSETSEFSMGLLSSTDWTAQWISDPTPAPLDVVAHNGFHSSMSKTQVAEKWVAIDLGSPRQVDSVVLYPASPYNWREKSDGFLFPIRFRVEIASDERFSDAKTIADNTAADVPNPKTDPLRVECSASTGRYIRLVVTKLGMRDPEDFGFALAEMQVGDGGKLLSGGCRVFASDWIDGHGWSLENLTDSDLVSHAGSVREALPASYFRKDFSHRGRAVRAILYASAKGVYDLFVNGSRVGDRVLAPEWTDYLSRIQYQAYDVTSLIRDGVNTIAAVVGDGWHSGRLGMSQALHPEGLLRGVYGRKTSLISQLEITSADGTVTTVTTDGTWHVTNNGPIVKSDLLDGETYDARKELGKFAGSAYDSSGWAQPSVEAPKVPLSAQPNEPIRVTEERVPLTVSEPKPNVFVFDMGQNMPGVSRLKLRAKSGDRIELRHAEMLNDDGTVYTANLRGAPQLNVYISRGDPNGETFEPRFTQHGFRYVEVTGLTEKPSKEDLTGIVFHSAPREIGSFESSDPMLNRLWKNVLWTQKANMMSVPTDCPQRDERLGWMGDIMVYGETSTRMMDMAAFFKKWIRDVRDAQAEDGRYPDFAPHPYGKDSRFTGVPGWGDAGVEVPMVQYRAYGDRRMLKEQLTSAKRWVDWIVSKNPNLTWRNARHNDYGDWLNGDTLRVEGFPERGSECPKEVFATLVLIRTLDQVARMAAEVGESADSEKYSRLGGDARERFRIEFVDADGKMLGDTQAGYALALGWRVYPHAVEKRAFEHLIAALERCDWRLSTGFHSTPHLLEQLVRFGRADLAMQLLHSKRFPSWGFMIENGATTIWERWDGYVKGRGFQDPGMNSFNHWAFGAVAEFMMTHVAGIGRVEDDIGWKRLRIAPKIAESPLSYAKGEFASPSGRVASSWTKVDGSCELKLHVPPGCEAEVILPVEQVESIMEGETSVSEAPGVTVLGDRLKVLSGTYRFRFKLAK